MSVFRLIMAVMPVLFAALPVWAQDAARSFELQGHRGARGLAPENSLPGFILALETGVTTLEMDLVMTSDGVLYVNHDRRLDPDRTRTVDGDWLTEPAAAIPIASMRGSDLGQYDIGRVRPGSRAADRFPDQRGMDGVSIPKLEHVLYMAEMRSNRTIRYNMEMKRSPLDEAGSVPASLFAKRLITVIRSAGIEDRTMIQSFDWAALDAVAAQAPELQRAYLTAEQDWLDNLGRGQPEPSPWQGGNAPDWSRLSVPEAVAEKGGGVWSPYFRELVDEDLARAQALGLRVIVWTVNEEPEMRDLIQRGVDGIITDYPDRLRRVMAETGMPLPLAFPLGPRE